MRTFVLVVWLCLMLVPPGAPTTASELPQGEESLAAIIDQVAASFHLPSGNGSVSSVEQNLGSAIETEVVDYDMLVAQYAGGTPENATWVDKVERVVGQINQTEQLTIYEDPGTIPGTLLVQNQNECDMYRGDIQPIPIDPRAQAVSGAADKYGLDPRAAAISGIADLYGTHASTPATNPALDPRVAAVTGNGALYVRENETIQGEPLTFEQMRAVIQTIKKSANQHIDQNKKVKYKNIAKRHISQIIELSAPSQMLPVNGYWRAHSFEMSTSGTCIGRPGDNDGPSGNEDEENDPGDPLCGYDLADGAPFIVWNGSPYGYLLGSGSMYGEEGYYSYEQLSDANGVITGSVRSKTTVIYEVVAPDAIIVHYVREEEGGCTQSGDYVLELVTADDSICGLTKSPTPEEAGQVPPKPPVVEEGPYKKVGQPYIQDEDECTDANRPPNVDELRLIQQPDFSVQIDTGVDTQIVYPDGYSEGYYSFDNGRNSPVWQRTIMTLDPASITAKVSWNYTTSDGKSCYVSQNYERPGVVPPDADEPEADDPSSPAGSDSSSGSTGSDSGAVSPAVYPAAGEYTVEWAAMPGIECPAALEPTRPTFTEATVTLVDGGLMIAGGEQSYLLTEQGGQLFYMVFGTDGSGVMLSVTAVNADGSFWGGFNSFAADGSACLLTGTFTPK